MALTESRRHYQQACGPGKIPRDAGLEFILIESLKTFLHLRISNRAERLVLSSVLTVRGGLRTSFWVDSEVATSALSLNQLLS
jgi:hypothetical protein